MPEQPLKPLEILRTAVDPQEIAIQYLKHEFIKLFPDQPEDFYSKMTGSIENSPNTLGRKDFWQLVTGISESYKLKWVNRYLMDSKYGWSLERISLADITMTGMSPSMDNILEAAEWNPIRFAQVWRANPQYAQAPEAQGIKAYPQRDHFPIMLREKADHSLKVFDGMRRVCIAAIAGEEELTTWVGRIVNPVGKMVLTASQVLFIRVLFDEATNKSPELLDALKIILKTYIKEYSNGREAVERAFWGWQRNPELAPIAKEILES